MYTWGKSLSSKHFREEKHVYPSDNVCVAAGADTKLLSDEMLALPKGTTTVHVRIDVGVALYPENAS